MLRQLEADDQHSLTKLRKITKVNSAYLDKYEKNRKYVKIDFGDADATPDAKTDGHIGNCPNERPG